MQEGNKKKAEIEVKATKNRKIRYIVHDKIINFLTPIENVINHKLLKEKNDIFSIFN